MYQKLSAIAVLMALIPISSFSLFAESPAIAQSLVGQDMSWYNTIHEIEPFKISVASDTGIDLRTDRLLSAKSGVFVGKGTVFMANAFIYGEPHEALGLSTIDTRWYRITHNGQKYWVPAGWVFGDAPDTQPNPLQLQRCSNGQYSTSC
ncbi:MAG: hypothetical protein KME64_35385 [Scytonematopsis contorta HA4267-MV1]|jgi:hypothetical protein|nr:hypothetical protein [Scytonematopsis contorta HA4267-MV1]